MTSVETSSGFCHFGSKSQSQILQNCWFSSTLKISGLIPVHGTSALLQGDHFIRAELSKNRKEIHKKYRHINKNCQSLLSEFSSLMAEEINYLEKWFALLKGVWEWQLEAITTNSAAVMWWGGWWWWWPFFFLSLPEWTQISLFDSIYVWTDPGSVI